MKIKRLICFGLAFILSYHTHALSAHEDKVSYAKEPAWLDEVTYELQSTDAKDASISYLLMDSQVNFTLETQDSFFRLVQQVNNKQGLSSASELFISFIPDYQTVSIHKIHLIRDGKTIDQSDVELKIIQQEQDLSKKIFTGEVSVYPILNDVQEHDIIDFSYTIKGSNPVFENRKFASFTTSWNIDVDKVNISIFSDKETPLNHKVMGSDIDVVAEYSEEYISYRWQDTNVKAEPHEDGYPSWYQYFDRVEFSEFTSWNEVAKWSEGLYTLDHELNDTLTKLNQKWWENAENTKQYVRTVVDYVQNDIRYFGLELAINSHKPRHPNLVFERKFGDCKDKALLITSLLSKYNVQSWPALVSYENNKGVGDRLPSPGAFDHVINKVVIDDEVFWIDGTTDGLKGSLHEVSSPYYGLALLVDNKTENLIAMDSKDGTLSRTEVSEQFISTAYDQPVSLEFSWVLTGHKAQHYRLYMKTEGKSELQTFISDYYKNLFSFSDMQNDLEVIDDQIANVFTINGSVLINNYWELEGGYRTIPLYGEGLNSFLTVPEKIDRRSPYVNHENIEVVHNIKVQLHDEIEWDLTDGNLKFENSFFNYQRTTEAHSNLLKVQHSYKPQSDYISAYDVKEFVDTVKDAREELYYSVVISQVDNEQNKLRNKLRSLMNLESG